MKQDELKQFVKKCLTEWPDNLNEKMVREAYLELRKSYNSDDSLLLIKSMLDKKYPKTEEEKENTSIDFSKSCNGISQESDKSLAKSIEAMYDIANDMIDFTEWTEDLSESNKIVRDNVMKIALNKKK